MLLTRLQARKQQSRSKLGPKVGPDGNPKSRTKVSQKCRIFQIFDLLLTYF